ncbi:integrase [Nocardia sp. NPDC051900]|uniref:integrase n=1 Tax=Nocardia sp. NPDC051900 TaxID=3364326 RepID=UPI003795673C
MAQIGGWNVDTLRRRAEQLRRVLAAEPGPEPIRLTRVRAELGNVWKSRIAARALDQCGLLVDDTESRTRQWIEHRTATLPPGFRDEVRDWLLALHEGTPRSKPRAEATLHAYYSRVHPPLIEWAHTRSHLREVTQADVTAILNRLTGHTRVGMFVALRSLFGFAKRHRLIFLDPTRRLRVGAPPPRALLPMTDRQIDAVTATAVTPLQRVVVALVAVYAARAITLRTIVLDDIDLPRRRIRIGGTVHQLTEFTHDVLEGWLTHRQQRWPGTPNRHLIVSADSVLATEPVPDYHLTWHLGLLGIDLEHIRGDRILQEAIAVDADPLHLTIAFGLSEKTAIGYSVLARNLMQRPIETTGRADDNGVM